MRIVKAIYIQGNGFPEDDTNFKVGGIYKIYIMDTNETMICWMIFI